MQSSSVKSRFQAIWHSPAMARAGRVSKTAVPLALTAAAGAVLYNTCPDFHDFADRTRVFLNEHPHLSSMTTSGILTGLVPDILAQRYEGGRIDLKRTFKMTLLGSLSNGLILGYFYNWVNDFVPGKGFWSTEAKIAIDQLCYAPVFIPAYLSAKHLLEGKSWTGFGHKLRSDWNYIIPRLWTFWWAFGAQAVYFAPLDLRVYIANVLSVLWYSILSNMVHKEHIQA